MRGMDNFFWHITESKLWAFEHNEKITVAIPAPVSGLTQWIRASVTLWENTFQIYKLFNQKMKRYVKCVQNIK